MANTTASRFDDVLAGYLQPNGWRRGECPHCGRAYFGKGSTVCGSPWCPGSRRAEQDRPSAERAAPAGLSTQWQRMRRSLERRGLTPFAMPGVRGATQDTDLVVSGLQYLDPVVHHGAPAPVGAQVLAQPCVRWRYLPTAGREEGTSSSFVNLTSLEVGGPDLVERVADHLDLWLDALSAVGLHARETTVALTAEDCEYGPYAGQRADVNVGGVEVGELNWYGRVTDAANRSLTVIDCGFAFERIAWAASWPQSYHSMLSPLFLSGAEGGGVVNDRIRSLALLALSGVTPGSRGPRRYVRQLANELSLPYLRGVNLPGCLEHATQYWQQFTLPAGSDSAQAASSSAIAALELANRAIERQAAARLAEALRQPAPPATLGFAGATDFLAARSGGSAAVRGAVDTLTSAG